MNLKKEDKKSVTRLVRVTERMDRDIRSLDIHFSNTCRKALDQEIIFRKNTVRKKVK